MIMTSSAALRSLLARYAIARFAYEERADPATARRLAEVSRTLCAATGARSVAVALAVADARLSGSGRGAQAEAGPVVEEGTAIG
ncbi:DUF5133 domain-containing protein [Streptomyces sp. NPDC052225]|uniref:DUF5133 domain-containing protein n=1 Tax=Streptomyces sp. NPDC052225 TaxID=3154949 RepID=UPI0034441995